MKHISFNENWSCTAYGKTEAVTLPHDAMVGSRRSADNATGPDLGFFTPCRAVYTKKFDKPDAEKCLLSFDGVMGLCEVSLNRQRVAFHPYGYTAFVCDLTPWLKDGENELTVTADTTAQVASRWYTGCGIYRSVELLTGGADTIRPFGVYVKTLRFCGDDAYAETEIAFDAAEERDASVRVEIAGFEDVRRIHLSKGENVFRFRYLLKNVKKWTPESPVMYECRAILDTGDSETASFGFRTVETDAARGFLLNGEPVKLRGGCVHHDNGIVGAASTRAAEERRIRILKSAGFNAVRCAHNPPSAVMLDVCDRLGMMVIDEIFDCWKVGKREFDYHLWFDGYWEDDTRSMVLRDRNHPAVVIWSTGNEISEKNGTSGGYVTHGRILDTVRALDPSRPVTHAFCTFWDNPEIEQKARASWDKPAGEMDVWAQLTAPIADTLDVVGYNYLYDRLDKDEVRFPNRLIAMTEAFPMDAAVGRKRMDSDPRFIGEFVWTAWDYFGETGIGHVRYDAEGMEYGLTGYPEHLANCGDFDLTGRRRPAGYYRDAMWNDGAVRVVAADPEKHGRKYLITVWGFHDVERTWTFPGSEGKTTDVFVFSLADEVELFVNGKSLGRKKPDEKGTAKFEAVYQPGEVTAKAYTAGVQTGEDRIVTAGPWKSVRIEADKGGKTGPAELVYCEIILADESGDPSWTADDPVTVSVIGGELVGTGSGRIDDEHIYTDPVCRAFRGRILAAVRPKGENTVVKAEAGGRSASIVI